MVRSWSDHSRIGRALEMTFQLFSANFCQMLGGHFAWQAQVRWRVLTVAPRIVNDVSFVMLINHEIHFAWQAQYLVRLEGVDCCSAHCNDVSYVMWINHEIHFSWQAQYLVRLEGVDCCSAHCK